MTDSRIGDPQNRRPHPASMSGPFLELDLAREVAQLRQEPEWASGQNARTLIKYDDLRVVLTTLAAGAGLPGHHTRGRITIQVLSGHLRVRSGERTFDLPAGRLLALDQEVPHDVEAVEESAFLLTIAWPAGG
jgi:quercetin dioxygenase-like cupin family protein